MEKRAVNSKGVKLHPAVRWKMEGQKFYMINLESSRYTVLEGTACYLVQGIAEGVLLHDLTVRFGTAYSISLEQAEADIRDFMQQLQKEGFVITDD